MACIELLNHGAGESTRWRRLEQRKTAGKGGRTRGKAEGGI